MFIKFGQVSNMQRLFSSLTYLLDVVTDKKPFDVIVSSGRKEVFFDIEKYLAWINEIWSPCYKTFFLRH
jgi:hypothetical protein